MIDSGKEKQTRELNVPICVVSLGMSIFSNTLELEELLVAKTCCNMAEHVFVDIDKKYVFIGENPQDETTGLVVYEEKRDTIFTREFFSRWQELRTLHFEFQVIDPKKSYKPFECIFCVTGLWSTDHWVFKEYRGSNRFEVL
jgi:hypothetical protein